MKTRRILSLALALVLCTGLIAVPAGAAEVTVTEVVPCQYSNVLNFSEGLAAVKKEGEWGYIDRTGKEVIPCQYDYAWSFSDGLAAVGMLTGETDEYNSPLYKWSYIDKTGKEVISCEYDEVYEFSNGLAAAEIDTGEKNNNGSKIFKYAFIDKTGKEVVPLGKYDNINQETWYRRWAGFSEGMAMVCVNGKWGFINGTGKEVIPCQYTSVEDFSEGFAGVYKETGEKNKYGDPISKWGFIDATGKEVVPCVYDGVGQFSEGLAAVCVQEYGQFGWTRKWGFIDKTGREVVPCQYADVYPPEFSEGLAAVRGDSGAREDDGRPIYKYGFIDKTGKLVIPCEYYAVVSFSDNLTAVKKWPVGDDTYQEAFVFIDKTGQELDPNQYDTYMGLPFFAEGYASVAISQGYDENANAPDLKWGFVDNTGAVVVPCQYDNFYPPEFSEGLAAVEKEGEWGFISITAPAAPVAQGTLGTSQEVTWEIDSADTLTLTLGENAQVDQTDSVYVACWDENDVFLGVKLLHDTSNTAATQLDPDWAKVKLIWTSADLAPKCSAAEATKSGS